jgi:hypothetical protein
MHIRALAIKGVIATGGAMGAPGLLCTSATAWPVVKSRTESIPSGANGHLLVECPTGYVIEGEPSVSTPFTAKGSPFPDNVILNFFPSDRHHGEVAGLEVFNNGFGPGTVSLDVN